MGRVVDQCHRADMAVVVVVVVGGHYHEEMVKGERADVVKVAGHNHVTEEEKRMRMAVTTEAGLGRHREIHPVHGVLQDGARASHDGARHPQTLLPPGYNDPSLLPREQSRHRAPSHRAKEGDLRPAVVETAHRIQHAHHRTIIASSTPLVDWRASSRVNRPAGEKTRMLP